MILQKVIQIQQELNKPTVKILFCVAFENEKDQYQEFFLSKCQECSDDFLVINQSVYSATQGITNKSQYHIVILSETLFKMPNIDLNTLYYITFSKQRIVLWRNGDNIIEEYKSVSYTDTMFVCILERVYQHLSSRIFVKELPLTKEDILNTYLKNKENLQIDEHLKKPKTSSKQFDIIFQTARVFFESQQFSDSLRVFKEGYSLLQYLRGLQQPHDQQLYTLFINNMESLYNKLLSDNTTYDFLFYEEYIEFIMTNKLPTHSLFIAYNYLGVLYLQKQEYDRAIFMFKLAVHYAHSESNKIMIISNICSVYHSIGKYEEAFVIAAPYKDSVCKTVEYVTNFGCCCLKMDRYEDALQCFNDVLSFEDFSSVSLQTRMSVYANAASIFLTTCQWEKIEQVKKDFTFENILTAYQLWRENKQGVFDVMAAFQSRVFLNDYIYWDDPKDDSDRKIINNILSKTDIPPSFKRKRKGNKENLIHIGYVSGDFYSTAVSCFIYPILQNHDPKKFKVFCFSNRGVSGEDEVTEKFKKLKIEFINIVDMSTQNVVQMIKSYEIKILIDLSGLTIGNRLDVFACRPAPFQISYLGYPNSTGLFEIDYRITDPTTHPIIRNTTDSAEKFLYLRRCSLCYNWEDTFVDVNWKPKKYVIFSSLNKLEKMNDHVLSAWRQILLKCPTSKFLLKLTPGKDFLIKIIADKLGISRDRMIVINQRLDQNSFERLYNNIDIALDTWPYSGTTTTCDALNMSTPVFTWSNRDTPCIQNVTSSILSHCDLSEFVASSEEEYINKAVELANNITLLATYKQTIRKRFRESMLIKDFMEEYELALSKILLLHF